MSTAQPFDPYSYAATQAAGGTTAQPFDPYSYASTSPSNPSYVAPTMGGGNTWYDAIKGIPQAVESGINQFGLTALGTPMDVANNVTNLGKAGIEAAMLEAGKTPPTWLDPTPAARVPLTSEWLKKEAAAHLGKSAVEVTGDPQSYVDQGISAVFGLTGPAPLFALTPSGVMLNEGSGASEMADNPQSLSAAAASPDLTRASPELRRAVAAAQENGTQINPEVLQRHLQAEALPVPTRLTMGQATQDPIILSAEQNQRGANGAFAQHFNEQNLNLAKNMQVMRDRVGPDVFTTNQAEHGEALINTYQRKAAAAEADINAKYQALRDANGGQFPVDAKTLNNNVSAALHKELQFEHAPAAEMRQLQQFADKGGMTLEQYEAMRTNLARIMRSSADGNERAAAGIIRSQMEELPLSPAAAKVKGLADTARAAARAQFEALRNDPAYDAAVNKNISGDKFVSRYVINGDRNDLATMQNNLAHDPVARQTIGTAALEHLRQSAALDDQFRGNFAAARYNKAIQGLGSKLNQLFGPEQIEDLSNIGDVARYETFQPRGSFVNNSSTEVARQAIAEHGKNLAEGVANAKTFGFGGTLARKLLKGMAERRAFATHIAPGAGITYVPASPGP